MGLGFRIDMGLLHVLGERFCVWSCCILQALRPQGNCIGNVMGLEKLFGGVNLDHEVIN